MYASLTTSTIESVEDDAAEVAGMAGETMNLWLREIDGFEGLLMLLDETTGTVQALTFWRSREVAERHREARMRLRDRVTETVSVDVEETRDYEVVYAQLGDRLAGGPG
jgi:heme-degrading monooxygenase HmoA